MHWLQKAKASPGLTNNVNYSSGDKQGGAMVCKQETPPLGSASQVTSRCGSTIACTQRSRSMIATFSLVKRGTGVSAEVAQITHDILQNLGKKVYSITNDIGTEFNDTASLPWKVYFSDPYKPQQRGTIENTIGLLREYIKRNTELKAMTSQELKSIENQLNFRPRKCLNFETPFEKFFKRKVALAMEI